jgi:hypothetical protein
MRNDILRKGLALGIISLFVGTSIVPSIVGEKTLPDESLLYNKLLPNNTLFSDTLDQENSDWRGEEFGNENGCMAQSFKPTLDMLTTVELIIFNSGTPHGNFTVSIRENLSSIDYTSITIPVEDIPQEFYPEIIWTEFDFPDIYVETEQTYFIVCSYNVQSNPNLTCWGITGNNYLRGEIWTWNNQLWQSNGEHDFCFSNWFCQH